MTAKYFRNDYLFMIKKKKKLLYLTHTTDFPLSVSEDALKALFATSQFIALIWIMFSRQKHEIYFAV